MILIMTTDVINLYLSEGGVYLDHVCVIKNSNKMSCSQRLKDVFSRSGRFYYGISLLGILP